MHFPAQVPQNKKNPPLKKYLILPEMELSSSNIKKILMFSQKKVFWYFSNETAHFQPKLEKKKKKKNRELAKPNTFLYFLKK